MPKADMSAQRTSSVSPHPNPEYLISPISNLKLRVALASEEFYFEVWRVRCHFAHGTEIYRIFFLN